MSTESNAKIFSVIGGCRRSGRWLVPHETAMLTLFGRAVIDLRDARTTAEELEFTCTSVFANVTFIVPEGAEVRPSGMAVFGSSKSVVPVSDSACDLPPMAIEATTVFGRLRIRTTEEAPVEDESRRQRRRRRKAEARRVAEGEPAVPTAIAPADTAARATRGSTAEATMFVPVDTSQFMRPEPDAAPDPDTPAFGAVRRDLSSPIEAFGQPAQAQSPLTDVGAPASLAGTVLDAETAPSEPESASATETEPEPKSDAGVDADVAADDGAAAPEEPAPDDEATETAADEPAGAEPSGNTTSDEADGVDDELATAEG